MSRKKPLTLLILDGWGHREPASDNAISEGKTPNWDRLWSEYPHGLLQTSGEAVGLPQGQMGNSEVGHMNIGAGRIVYQELTRISKAIEDKELEENEALVEGLALARKTGNRVHIMGLLSPGGVHSHEDHLLAVVDMAAHSGVPGVAVHAFLDGRDTPPRSAEPSIKRLETALAGHSSASLASVSGRYYAMDRDQRWERVRRAWDAIVAARAECHADSGTAALAAAYERDEDDEFVQPTLIGSGCRIEDGDVVIFINFRADRARELCQALVSPDFQGFEARRPHLGALVTMTRYQDDLPALVAFPPTRMEDLLGEVLSRHQLRQLRIAETEKYAHVTYFFNGGEETVFDGEERELIPSPKVATYDLKPEMSAPELTRRLVEAIDGGQFDVIVANVANPDMVGHSGKFEAAVAAVEAVDQLLGAVVAATEKVDGEILITADHGNVEQMSDPDSGQAHTAHTTNLVPLVYVGSRQFQLAERGSLRDLAPTMLSLLGLEVPKAMSGQSLLN
ncbi:MAG: 2,3-bisphosphoglycerate-independent phosphoglycerate mutase [Wenzhouxiangella sp.]|nr:MAG: 2,3-bisphosphoglycerate-independent phosphoglycerate mutase [Wenzhouxiangella sp.]